MRISDWSSDVCSSDLAAVQRVGAVVERKLVGPAIERKATARDTIGIAADGDAEIIGLVDIAREVVIAEYDVRGRPRAVWGFERLQGRAIGDDTRLHARFIGERTRPDGPAVRPFAYDRKSHRLNSSH